MIPVISNTILFKFRMNAYPIFFGTGAKIFVVWDKSASIEFIVPAKKNLTGYLHLSDHDLMMIWNSIKENGFTTFDKTIEWNNASRKGYAIIIRTIYVTSK